MKTKKLSLTVKDIAIVAMLTVILFLQEEALVLLPNIQLTIFLIVLYSKKLGFFKTTIIVTIHVILDNLYMGSFTPQFVIFMWIGWMIIPVFVSLFLKKTENPFFLALGAALFGLTYSWVMVIPSVFIYKFPFIPYLIADIPFEAILAICGFVTTILLYKPLSKVFDRYITKPKNPLPNDDNLEKEDE